MNPNPEPSALCYPGAGPAVLTAKCKGLTGMVLSTSSRQLKDISRSCNGKTMRSQVIPANNLGGFHARPVHQRAAEALRSSSPAPERLEFRVSTCLSLALGPIQRATSLQPGGLSPPRMISYTHMAVNRATRLFLYCKSSSLAQASRFSFKIPALLCCQGFKQDIPCQVTRLLSLRPRSFLCAIPSTKAPRESLRFFFKPISLLPGQTLPLHCLQRTQ